MKHYKKIFACILLITHTALFSYQNRWHQNYYYEEETSSKYSTMLFAGLVAFYIAQLNNTEHKLTANSLNMHPYADKNLVIRAYNEKNPNLLSNKNDKRAYDALIAENAKRNCTDQTIPSVYEDYKYSINWSKFGTSEFLTRN